MYLSGIDFANVNWDKAFKSPELLKHLVPDDGNLPDWIVDIREQRLLTDKPGLAIIKKRSQIRTGDCKSWIKKANYQVRGIRKRKPEGRKSSRIMAPATLAQYQRHSIHLISRVLNVRTNASPFTLILDDLNQRAVPLVSELVRRGLSRNVNVVTVTFEAAHFHPAVRNVPAYGQLSGEHILQDIRKSMKDAKESLVIVDSLYEVLEVGGVDITKLFHLVAAEFASTLIGIYHQDMLPAQDAQNAYAPQLLDLLKYLATTVITCKSFAHVLAAKAAKERSLAEPTHGLLQSAEGIVQCLDANDHRGIVFEAEFRRRSGRPESDTYFLRNARPTDYNMPIADLVFGTLKQEFVTLLDLVPLYASQEVIALVNATANEIESTFNLGLTDKQKQAREGVVLPYFDAQKGDGGEGGRILYDMGSEDDFDEEEDEI